MKRLKKYADFYRIAHAERARLFNGKWRFLFVLFTSSALILVKEYLDGRYPYTVYDALKSAKFLLSDRMFEWFGLGILFGFIAVSLMHEGEFLLQLRKFVHGIEQQTESKVQGKRVRKSAKQSKRKN
ncbi:MAG TPA: hypothetical protein VI874_00730 [Candidatus Norongarragalinales archaeon]|nr:hypothetical protein [Candidatus Norongarragalinales archaeon]